MLCCVPFTYYLLTPRLDLLSDCRNVVAVLLFAFTVLRFDYAVMLFNIFMLFIHIALLHVGYRVLLLLLNFFIIK